MTADTVGGVWTYALQLAEALQPHRINFTIATMGLPLSSEQREAVASVENVEVCESTFKLEWMDDPWADVEAAGGWLLELERQLRPDIVHLNGYAHGSLSWNAPVLMVGHSCVLSWWRAVHHEEAPPQWNQYRSAVCEGLNSADVVVAPSHAMLNSLEQHYGLVGGRVIYNGRTRPTAAHQIKQGLILSAGRLWDAAKNFSALDRIAPTLRWPVFVAGDIINPNGGACETSNLKCLGRLPNRVLQQWLKRASIYVLPARYEPFGLSILEAALTGCALVLGDIPSLREIWGDAACYIPPDNPDALREVLNELAATPAKVAALSDAARGTAARYSVERMAKDYLQAYSELLSDNLQADTVQALAI